MECKEKQPLVFYDWETLKMADYKAIRIIHAIMAINPNAKVNVWDNDIDRIDWTISYWDETEKKEKTATTTEISKSDILAKQKELQDAWDAAYGG